MSDSTSSLDASAPRTQELLGRLAALPGGASIGDLARRLAALETLTREDVVTLEGALARVPNAGGPVGGSSEHLLRAGGKRLRPLCVALAARMGTGFDARAVSLAVAVELVHAATLLHDDVVDLGEMRRGQPAARIVFGNAAAIFAGDWLLVEALGHVVGAGMPDVLDGLLATIREMIVAESVQLERRGRTDGDAAVWRRIVDGKTASLFGWALAAGGRAGGVAAPAVEALGRCGRHLGVAYQLQDDLLDLVGDPAATGKALGTDLREGKLTLPLALALEREPRLKELLAAAMRDEAGADPKLVAEVRQILQATGSVENAREVAAREASAAAACLTPLAASPARDALIAVTEAAVARSR